MKNKEKPRLFTEQRKLGNMVTTCSMDRILELKDYYRLKVLCTSPPPKFID